MNAIADVFVERHYRVELSRPILENVKWRIEEGQHWALVGANGCGKSTLLSIVSGDLWPSKGVVRVLGGVRPRRQARAPEADRRRELGALRPAPERRHRRRDRVVRSDGHDRQARRSFRRRAREGPGRALEVGAESTGNKPYGVLSQGERQRVMIARALVNDPELLIFDEPCNGLDPVARERFLADLGDLARRSGADRRRFTSPTTWKRCRQFVTHALVLSEGRVLARGERLRRAHARDADLRVRRAVPGRLERARVRRRYRLWVDPRGRESVPRSCVMRRRASCGDRDGTRSRPG